MQLNRIYILSLLVLCAVASASAQPLRVNRHQLRVEGIAFQRVAGISEDNYLYVEDFSIMAGETKTVPVYLHGTRPMWTFQLDVNTTGGLVVDDACLSGSFAASSAGGQFSFDCGTVGSAFRIVVYNQQKTMSITPSDRLHVIDLTITAPANATAADASILLQNFEFIDATTNRGVVGTDKSCQVHVLPRFAESITLDKTAIEMPVGSAEQLTATVLPDDLTDKGVTWSSSDPAIATVDASGLVTAVAVGTATVTATTTDGTALTASCQVTVQPILATGITLEPATATLTPGQTTSLTATVTPVNATDKGVTWTSSDPAIATVDASGLVTAVAVGTATVTATTTDGTALTASCQVTVQPILATGITLEPATASLTPGQTTSLTATVTPANATDKGVTWSSSDPAIATVDASGLVTAVAVGTATVTATATDGGGATATCIITVSRPQATSMSLASDELSLSIGDSAAIAVVITPEDADHTLRWTSSKPSVATVDDNGVVTALAQGFTIVTVSTIDGSNLTAACLVTVQPRKAASIALSHESLDIVQGSTGQLTATVLPDNATDKGVTWSSSDPAIATVDASGLVTAVAVGTATVSATTTDGTDLTASCQVTVLPIVATGITLEPLAVTITAGETCEFALTITPDNATYKTARWSSSDEAVATVDESGMVTAVAPGQAQITATTVDGTELSATSVVTVLARKATGITVAPDSVLLDIGGSTRLTATIEPADVGTTVLLWQSSDEDVAIVTSKGMVYAVGAGQALITATTTDGSNLSDTCHVTVQVPFELSAQDLAVPVNTLRDIPVSIDNHVPVKSFALTVNVPEGIDFMSDALPSARCSDFDITTTYNADSTVVRIEGIMTNQAMSAGKAPFVLLPIKSSKYIDTFVLNLTDITFVSTNDGVGEQQLDDITVTLRVLDLGDVNGDKIVDVSDVNALVNYMLGKQTDMSNFGVGDMNGDGVIDVSDINAVVNLMLGKG